MKNISKLEDSYIALESSIVVDTMKVLDINKIIEIYNLIQLELLEIEALESEPYPNNG